MSAKQRKATFSSYGKAIEASLKYTLNGFRTLVLRPGEQLDKHFKPYWEKEKK